MKRHLLKNQQLRFATWNVRTLNDTCRAVGRLEMLILALKPYQVEVCGLSEVRWPGHGHIQAPHGWSIVYSGPSSDRRERGVGFALSPQATQALIGYTPVSERIIIAQFRFVGGSTLSVIQAYAPTNESSDEDKDAFYATLSETVQSLCNKVDVLVLGDFNAQLLKSSRNVWQECLGPFAVGKATTTNGYRLLQFAQSFGMAIKSTFFKHPSHHLHTWYSPDGVTRTQIDHALIVRHSCIKVLDCRVFRGADFDTDHRLLSVVI